MRLDFPLPKLRVRMREVRRAAEHWDHEPALLQLSDDLGHRRGLDPFEVGEFPWRQRAGQLQAGQHRELAEGEITDRASLADPPIEALDGLAQHLGQFVRCPRLHRPLHHDI